MRRFTHIAMSILVIITFIVKYNFKEFSLVKIMPLLSALIVVIIIVNLFVWLIQYFEEKIFLWIERKKQKNYSLLTWLGDSSIPLELYKDLSKIKKFSSENFYDNYQIVKEKITVRYKTINELKGLKNYLELRTSTQKFTAILSSTQTILIAIIIPTVITFTNIKTFNSPSSSISAILFVVFWLILLTAIDFITKQIDKMKELLRLVNECIDEKTNEVEKF